MSETKQKEVVKTQKATTKPKPELSYHDLLESRAQRGEMTHQKKLALRKLKKKEMKGE